MPPIGHEEVVDRAEKWARLHRKESTRPRMDECLAGLDEADQRRVYLCGQRIAAGMSPKHAFLPTKGKEENAKKKADPVEQRGATDSAPESAGADKGKVAGCPDPRTPRQGKAGRNTKPKK